MTTSAPGPARRPLYRHTASTTPGAVADPRQDLLRLDELIASAPPDYPGLAQLHTRRAELVAAQRRAE